MPKPGQQAPRKWVVEEDGSDGAALSPLPAASDRRERQRRAIFAFSTLLVVVGGVGAYMIWGGGAEVFGLTSVKADPTVGLDARVLGDVYRIVDHAESLDEAAAQKLEASLKKTPDDLRVRTLLIAFYSNLDNRSQSAGAAHAVHVHWLIDNEPSAPILGTLHAQMRFPDAAYKAARKALLAQLQESDKDLVLLRNAGTFLGLHDAVLAEGIFARGQALDRNNPEWSRWRGELAITNDRSKIKPAVSATSDKALAAEHDALEKALAALNGGTVEVPPGNPPFAQLGDLAISAWQDGHFEKARKYALAGLRKAESNKESWAYGEVVHWANVVVGHLALKVKRTDLAEKYLLRAGRVPSSPRMNVRGPDLSLVKALLALGRRETVLAYLDLCKAFWAAGKEKGTIARWVRQLKSDQDPDFKTP